MAISSARFARTASASPLPPGVHPLRRPRDGAPSREREGDGRRDAEREDGRSSRRDPAWLAELTTKIDRSVEAIERVVARVGTIREDNSQLRAATSKLRASLQAERAESGRRLLEQGQSMSREKRRAAEAERNADALAGMLCDLERQLSVLHEERRGVDRAPAPDSRPARPFRRAV